MNSNADFNNQEFQEQLVAYLDGELEDAESHQIESLVVRDPRAREELHKLEQAWDLLDELPRQEVSSEFVRTTLEMAALSTEQSIAPTSGRKDWNRRFLVLNVALALLVGILATEMFYPDPSEEILRDFPLIRDLEGYRQLDNVDFLRKLNEEKLFSSSMKKVTQSSTVAPNPASPDPKPSNSAAPRPSAP